MDILPVLKKNSYLTVLIKDNYISANLAYTDLSVQRTYVLSDRTDLSPLKFRLDDIVFNKEFWFEYFNSLEKVFDWDIIDREWGDNFKIKEFEREEVGVTGIKVIVDDNQPFFKNIFLSLKEFSKDIVLRILDDRYMEVLVKGLVNRLEYDDIVWLDLDFSHFSIYRGKKEKDGNIKFVLTKIDWANEIGLIDFVKSSKLNAFLSVDSSSEDILNRWANCIAHGYEYISDAMLNDIIRAFTTLQILSTKQSNKEKFDELGKLNTAIFISGKIPQLLEIRELLLSVIDGLELDGVFDLFVDRESKLFTYGRSMIEKEESESIVVLKGDILPKAIKLLIPEVPSKSKSKIIFSGKIYSQLLEPHEIYSLGSSLEIFKLPSRDEKLLIEGELKNGTVFSHLSFKQIQYISSKKVLEYEYLVIDGRSRPIVYGPSPHDNRVKLRIWGNGDKE
ncbi:MAG: hypothetical protein UR61_C0019G0008 [candidate division WS6 bacterium GW2011_GWE1_34_7]|uniref:Uncharacterized protein n=1 Tax=candidate division WS6 bacterium GW2011_GWE1_34_7 TaxID=1619093 RepID=A0A0G0DR09_9BACT|nr:MAG: hypothetical protein UR61_C0019G0008 [candidate division WS6 bacterium GW2011_GWE1_34_7]